ncbi:MAG: hypothetical protein LBI15_03040 [Dysgonamonadaceae bacterium]|jgi:hypothetical protein|nr:hypothetical protein [Dysgonamonadaceae bacterium]
MEHNRIFAQYNEWIKECHKMIRQTYPDKLEELDNALENPLTEPRVEFWDSFYLYGIQAHWVRKKQRELNEIYEAIDNGTFNSNEYKYDSSKKTPCGLLRRRD